MTRTVHVVSQGTRDKVLQLRPKRCCVVLATEKLYALYIKYRNLNVIGCDSDFCMP